MVAYLANGWFTEVGPRRLRAEVVDGALDTASSLHQAGLAPEALQLLVLRVRTLAFLLSRERGNRGSTLDAAERRSLHHALREATDSDVALQAFVLDCCEHIGDIADVRGLYLHLLHVTHVVGLLRVARAQAPAAVARLGRMALSEAGDDAARQWQTPR